MEKVLDKLIRKSFTKIVKLFPKETLYKFVNSPYDELPIYRFTIGQRIVEQILKDNTRIYREFVKNGIIRKDKMAFFIMEKLHIHLKTIKQLLA